MNNGGNPNLAEIGFIGHYQNNEIVLDLPFQQRLYILCAQAGKGNIIVLSLQEEVLH